MLEAKTNTTETTASTAVAAYNPLNAAGISGEIDASDVETPRLGIINRMSRFPDMSKLGCFSYAGERALTSKVGEPLAVIFLSLVKRYQEDLPYGSKSRPQRFANEAAALAAGFEKGQIVKVGDLRLIVEHPMGVIEFGGKKYLPALWTVQSTAYGATVPKLVTPIMLAEQNGRKAELADNVWTLATKEIPNDKGAFFAPVLSAPVPIEAAAKAFFLSLFN